MLKYLLQSSEIGAGTRGSSLGPDAVIMESLNTESEIFKRSSIERLSNRNDTLINEVDTPNAIRIKPMLETWEKHAVAVSQNLKDGHLPVVISGDHASAGATIAGIKMANPSLRLGVIWVDAHADMHSPYTTPSGNIHGMPLAASLGIDNLDMQRNQPSNETIDCWKSLKNLGGICPKIQAEDLKFVGVRDIEKEEVHLLESNGIKNYKVSEVDDIGMEKIGDEILASLSECDMIYVSFDVDSMDPDEVSYGTGTPVPDGISPTQASILLSVLLSDKRVSCFEMVEVNPLLDKKGNKMAKTALGILENAVKVLENR